VLVREFDERLRLTERLVKVVRDPRDRRYVDLELLTLLRQRLYQIAAGYEDANDASYLRDDPTMRAVSGTADRALASQPTLSRLENAVDWESIRLLESEGTEWFCRHGATTGEIILDMDSTEDPTHGQQAFSFYNGHYDSYMYHPLLIFEGQSGVLLASRLRPGNAMGSRQAVALLRPLVRRLRGRFAKRSIALRADAGFCNPEVDGIPHLVQQARLLVPAVNDLRQRHRRTYGEYEHSCQVSYLPIVLKVRFAAPQARAP
jgi:hypothetical protein